MISRCTSVALLLWASSMISAQEKLPKPGETVPKNAPIQVTITAKSNKATLDLKGKTSEQFKKAVEDAVEAGGLPPAPSMFEFTVEVKNISKEEIQMWHKGDSVVLTLEVKGKNAMNVRPPLAFTADFRLPEAMTLKANQTHTIPVRFLRSGFRGASQFSYFTAPGDYEIVASFKTGVSPKPEGAQDFDGFGIVQATSKPFKVTVAEKK